MPLANRVRALAAVLLIVGLILLIIWVVEPLDRPGLSRTMEILAGALSLGSAWLFGDSRARLGLRVDNFGKALAAVLPVTVTAAAAAIAVGFYLGRMDPPVNAAVELATYFAWAAVQQYTLQSVILLRLEDAGFRGASPIVAAVIFSLVHAPNPGLVVLTFFGGLLWCFTFRRNPNIVAVALSHAVLAVVINATLPPQVTGGYRIGPPYLERVK